MPGRRVTLSAVLAAVPVLLVAQASGTPSASAVPAEEPAAPPAYTEYVALGDSYSAGPLIPQQRPDSVVCVKSTNNYPAFLATYLALPVYTDVTCSGAETTDMRTRQDTIVPGPAPAPQLDALAPTTDLVTLGIGGNDYGLFGSMIGTCEELRSQDPEGSPCREHFTVDGVDTKKRDARLIEGRVAEVVREILGRSPAADVFVVGYPRLLPEKGTCPEVPFAAGDYIWGNQVERILNRSLRSAAEDNGATYVDLYPASEGHDACAGADAWINGTDLKPLEAADYHPYLVGMRGMSRAAYEQITGLVAAEVEYASSVAEPTVAPVDEEQLRHVSEVFEDYFPG